MVLTKVEKSFSRFENVEITEKNIQSEIKRYLSDTSKLLSSMKKLKDVVAKENFNPATLTKARVCLGVFK